MDAITARKNRTQDFTVTLFEADGETAVVLAATDEVRFKAYKRDGDTPILDIDSIAALSGGSVLTIDTLNPASVTLRIAQGDIDDVTLGTYRFDIGVVDDSDSDLLKHAESGILRILESGGGDIGLS